MIIGIGTDLVEISRVRELLDRKGERALRRLFTPAETRHCQLAGQPAQSFAARFAAKEALLKALGTGWGQGIAWTEVEVVSLASGAPSLRLAGVADQLARQLGVQRVHLSLTHTAELASAYVVLEG